MAEKTFKQKMSDLTQAIAATDNHLYSITEKSANKVNSFTNVTNEAVQYPTVKAVKDYIGDTGTGLATIDYVDGEIDTLLGGASEAFDTLQELAEALGEDPNFATTITTELNKKALKTITITGTGGLTGGGSLASNRTLDLSQATKDNISKGLQGHAHISKTDNPHNVTKAQVGLGNVDNTSDMNKPVSTAQGQAINSVQNNLEAYKDIVGHYPFPNYREMYLNSLDDMGSGTPITPNGPSIAVSNGVLDGSGQCDAPLISVLYYNGNSDGINVGDTLYTDPQFSAGTTYNGSNRWFNTDNGKLIKVAPDGQVSSITFCDGSGGDDGGSGTTGRHILISSSSEAIHNEDGPNACRFGANISRYYDGNENIAVGDKIYTDAAMTVSFNGSNRWWMTSQGKTIKVSITGTVDMVGVCGDEYLPVDPMPQN